eukprot:3438347-Rhodomonas_salina.1
MFSLFSAVLFDRCAGRFTSNALISQQHLGAGSSGGMEPADPACVPAARSLLKPPVRACALVLLQCHV